MNRIFFLGFGLLASVALIAGVVLTVIPEESTVTKLLPAPSKTDEPSRSVVTAAIVSASSPLPISAAPASVARVANSTALASGSIPSFSTHSTTRHSVKATEEPNAPARNDPSLSAVPPPLSATGLATAATAIPSVAYEEELEVPTGAPIPAALYDDAGETTPAISEALDQIADQFIEDVAGNPSTNPSEQPSSGDGQWDEAVAGANALHRSIVGFQRADRAARLSAMEQMGVSE